MANTLQDIQAYLDFMERVGAGSLYPSAIVGRTLEEAVELALANGLTAGRIMERVTDALANEARKTTEAKGQRVYPSQLNKPRGVVFWSDVIQMEIGGVLHTLLWLCHQHGITLQSCFDAATQDLLNWEEVGGKFRVDPESGFYKDK